MRNLSNPVHFFTQQKPELGRQIAVPILILLALLPIFKTYFTKPNSLSYSFGGDSLVLYYDMIFHVRYGQGATLHGMNYPYGEYIFLTDAQGALASLLGWVNRNLLDVSDHLVGIIHSLNLYLLPVCALLVYHLFKAFKVSPWLSVPCSVLIAIMAPQVMRLHGHFGLAYPFLIPLAMLWFVRKQRLTGQLEWRDLLVLAILVFFTFNNPYIGFGAAGLLMVVGGLAAVSAFFGKKQLRSGLLSFAMGALAMLIPFVNFTLNDICTDRVAQQFGFFWYHASLDGTFFPPNSLLNHLLRIVGLEYKASIEVESRMGIGLVASLLLAALAIRMLVRFFTKKGSNLLAPDLKLLLAGSIVMYLLAANYSLYGWAKDWMEANLGPLLMFKASGRIAWSFYFTATISAVVFLDFLVGKIKQRSLAVGLVAVLLATWSIEYNLYVGMKFRKSFHDNFFEKKHEQALLAELRQAGFDASQFSSMLVVPKMMAWSDLMMGDLNWAAQFYSMRISAATGLPMLNAMLSRICTGHMAEGVQLTSHPVIPKERLSKLPNRKDILLVLGSGYDSLTVGERHLVELASPLLKAEKYSLYRLKLEQLEQTGFADSIRAKFQLAQTASPAGVTHLSFEEMASPHSFYGKGAFSIKKGENQVATVKFPFQADSAYLFSAWNHLDYTKYDMGRWKLTVFDSLGQQLDFKKVEVKMGTDVQDGWLRTEIPFTAQAKGSLKIEMECKRDFHIDELELRPLRSTHFQNTDSQPAFLWNNYKVYKTAGK